MADIEIRIPQLGEGLREARLVQFFKEPGDRIAVDEPIFEMETDKALMEIEAPAAGVLAAWTAHVGEVLPIGAVIGRISADGVPRAGSDGARAAQAASETPTAMPAEVSGSSRLRNALIPPRTRAYAREKGVSDERLAEWAEQATGKLTPADIDRLLGEAERPADRPAPGGEKPQSPVLSAGGLSSQQGFRDVPVPPRQRSLIFRMQQSAQQVVPATVEVAFAWENIEALRKQLNTRPELHASQFLLFSWCVARAARSHPRFRSVMLNGSVLREYDQLNMGLAVARSGDELVTARVDGADTLPFEDFARRATEAIERARRGEDQINETVQMSVTHMPGSCIRVGIPVVVSPAVATLFLGPPFDEAVPGPDGAPTFRRTAVGVMTFDHRAINGTGASSFLRAVQKQIARLPAALSHLL